MKILRKYRISLAIALAIWVVCLIPIPETPLDKYSFVDEWTHFVMYGILTISMLYESRSMETSTHILLIPIGNGLLVELAQAYLTTCRSGDWFDALCNTLGVFVGAAIFWSLSQMRRKK
jgi:VanZ family protein